MFLNCMLNFRSILSLGNGQNWLSKISAKDNISLLKCSPFCYVFHVISGVPLSKKKVASSRTQSIKKCKEFCVHLCIFASDEYKCQKGSKFCTKKTCSKVSAREHISLFKQHLLSTIQIEI